jgi:hypothetical protein
MNDCVSNTDPADDHGRHHHTNADGQPAHQTPDERQPSDAPALYEPPERDLLLIDGMTFLLLPPL